MIKLTLSVSASSNFSLSCNVFTSYIWIKITLLHNFGIFSWIFLWILVSIAKNNDPHSVIFNDHKKFSSLLSTGSCNSISHYFCAFLLLFGEFFISIHFHFSSFPSLQNLLQFFLPPWTSSSISSCILAGPIQLPDSGDTTTPGVAKRLLSKNFVLWDINAFTVQ